MLTFLLKIIAANMAATGPEKRYLQPAKLQSIKKTAIILAVAFAVLLNIVGLLALICAPGWLFSVYLR